MNEWLRYGDIAPIPTDLNTILLGVVPGFSERTIHCVDLYVHALRPVVLTLIRKLPDHYSHHGNPGHAGAG